MLVGTALPPTGAAQQSDEEGISLIALSVTSDVAQTHMYPAFHPDETRYDVAAPSEGDRVTVNAVAPPGEDVIWTGDDADPNLPGFQLVLTAGASTWISVAVNTFDLDAPLKFYGVSVSRASSEPKGWRVYHDIRVETMVDGASLPSHYLHGVWADSTRVLTSGGRIHSELTGDERFDEKLFAFNASDGSRRLADEFVLGGRPSEGIWSDGTTLWAMDWYGHLRAYDLSDGSLIANKGFNVRPSSFGHDGNGNSVKYTDNPSPRGIWSDGETVWILDRDRGKVLAYVLDGGSCSSWDFCRQEDKDFDLAGDNGTPWGITAGKSTANGDVDTWWVSDVDDDKLYAYNRSDGSRNASLDFDTLKSAGVTMPLGLHATDAIMYVVDFIENRVFAFSMPYVSGPIGPALVSSDATLSSLSLSNATLSPAPFDSAHTLYTAQVDNDVTSTTITAIPNHSLAIAVVLDGSTAAEGGVVHLDQVGPNSVNTFTVRVTAPDGSINDYTVGVERRALSTDATLVGLTLSGVLEGNWGFVSDVFDYDVGVDNGVTSTTVTASLNDSGASYVVQLGGVTDNDRMIDLAEGDNEITVVVTAEDGVATEDYTVRVTRAEPPPSSDASLNGLELTGVLEGNWGFMSDDIDYDVTVGNGVTSTTVTATLNDSGAEYVVQLGGVTDNDRMIDLAEGENEITVVVTAEDDVATKTYTVTVTRAEPSGDASLNGLELTSVLEGNWGFMSDDIDYDVTVGNGVTSTTVTATLNDSGAEYVVQLGGVTDNDRMIDLAEGENEITVVVTAEDDVATKTYTVTVTRATPSNDAFLFSLSLSGVDDDDLDFATDTYSYRVDVANGLTSTKVTATANDAAANIKITLGTTVAESNAMVDLTVDLAVGENEIIVEVTSRDSTKQEYTVTVDRDEPPPSSDASLSALSFSWVSAEDLGFVSDDFDYDVTVAHGLTVTTVEATTTDAGASYVVYLGGIEDTDRSINLAEGANAITVVVTAADGLTMMTYTVTVTRESEPALDDATLWKLELSDVTLNPVFVPATEMYTPPPVANGVTSTTVTAIPNHADATYVVQLDGVDDLDGTVGLDVGENVITVVVTAADNAAIKTYKVTVTRAASTPPPGNSGNTGNTGGGNNGGGIIGGGGNNNGGGDGGANDESSTTEEESDTESPYTDVGDGGTKQEDAINALYGLGVLTGTECEENRICPNDALTRWLAAVWLVRILDGKEPPAITESRFADVNASSMWEESMWFAPHVERLAELGITVGCSVTAPARYCPDDSLTRDQVASWLVRAFDLDSAASQGFTDTVDSTHETDIDSVVAAGIMSGCSTNPDRFCSQTVVTRGELALYVDRARKLSSDS